MRLYRPVFGILLALLFTLSGWAQTSNLPLNPLPLDDLGAFRAAASNWSVAGSVYAERSTNHALNTEPGTGILVNHPTEEHRDNLFTAWTHGDLELELEVMMPKGSNSGLYFQGRYEIQLLDSWGTPTPAHSDLGGIYQRWDESRDEDNRGYDGIAPAMSVARAPGLWQHLRVVFQAPRFDASGQKTSNARFLEVMLNGVMIHENAEATGPTRAAAFDDEQPEGPLMIQGDHGPVAFRNIRYKRYTNERVTLSQVQYQHFEGIFTDVEGLDALTPQHTEAIGGLIHDAGEPEDKFARRYTGQLHIPRAGEYLFHLELGWITGDPHFQGKPIGGGLLSINGQRVINHTGASRTLTGTASLTAGTRTFELTYYKNRGWQRPLVVLYAEGPAFPLHALNEEGSLPAPAAIEPILVEPTDMPEVLRTMVMHQGTKRTHAITVGAPGGIHYAFDLAQGALLAVWKGGFIDATAMWHSRGQDQLGEPRGSRIVLAGVPTLSALSEAVPWPTTASDYHFTQYTLDEAGYPAFSYEMAGIEVISDRLVPDDSQRMLTRTLHVRAPEKTTLWLHLATGNYIEQLPDGTYGIDDLTYYLDVQQTGGTQPVIGTVAGQQVLLLPIQVNTEAITLQYAIIW